jgi:hypothetical protein
MIRYLTVPLLLMFTLGLGAGWALHGRSTDVSERYALTNADIARPEAIHVCVIDGEAGGSWRLVDCKSRQQVDLLYVFGGVIVCPVSAYWTDAKNLLQAVPDLGAVPFPAWEPQFPAGVCDASNVCRRGEHHLGVQYKSHEECQQACGRYP